MTRALLEQALEALECVYSPNYDGAKIHSAKAAIRSHLATPQQERKPAWHDAPTEPGLWLCDEGDENPYRFTCHRVTFPLNRMLIGEGERWYGPIPEDKP